MRYSIEPKDRIYAKKIWIFIFCYRKDKNMGKNLSYCYYTVS